jgi:hypothetical protein
MAIDAYKGKRIIFVMGAGASLPFVRNCAHCLSTEYLTTQVFNRKRWSAIYDAFKAQIPATAYPECNFTVSLDDIWSVIEKLERANEYRIPASWSDRAGVPLPETCDDVYGIGPTNFEYLLYLLDRVSNCLDDRKSNRDNILFDVWGGNDPHREELERKRGWGYVPYVCREVLVTTIVDIWESCKKKKAIEDNQLFLTSVLETFEYASIYSLNYDPLLYEAAKQIKVKGVVKSGRVNHEVDRVFETGFSDGSTFNPKTFYRSPNVMAFLHGHVGFVPAGTTDDMQFEEAYAKAQKKRISGVACGQGGHYRRGPKGIHYNGFLTSGWEKFESFYDNPYACYIQRFARDVIESKYIVFVGSSLGDQHINLWATNAWRLANGYAEEKCNLSLISERSVDEKKMIIVTWDKVGRTFREFLLTSPIGRPLYDLFKESISSCARSDSSLKTNGYADINAGFRLDLNGTEKFFSEVRERKYSF